MFDVGFAELFLLALIGLLVLGPERLPKAARTLGGMVRKARASWFALRRSIESELAAADMVEPVKSVGKDLEEISRRIGEIHAPPADSTDTKEPPAQAGSEENPGAGT
jgi:sec-independent protein translocase protein TatB